MELDNMTDKELAAKAKTRLEKAMAERMEIKERELDELARAIWHGLETVRLILDQEERKNV